MSERVPKRRRPPETTPPSVPPPWQLWLPFVLAVVGLLAWGAWAG